MASRSGRFKVTLAVSGRHKIISGRGGAFYRIFNSGDSAFKVVAGTSETVLEPTFTLDVVVPNSGSTQVEIVNPSASNPVDVEGIYDYLDPWASLRSGRFNVKSTPDSGTHPHLAKLKIIDLNFGNPPDAYYRVFNSGDISFKVWEDDPPASGTNGLIVELAKDQSFDFAIATNNKRDIYITAANYPIEGIYEFLGSE